MNRDGRRPSVSEGLARAVAPCLAALRIVTGVALLVMVAVTMGDVLGRHFLGGGVPGVVEIVEFAQTWLIFLGIALAFGSSAHIVLDMVDLLVPPGGVRFLVVLGRIASVVVMGGFAWICFPELLDKIEWGDRTIDLKIPLSWFWAAMVTGFALSALLALCAPMSAGAAASQSRNGDE